MTYSINPQEENRRQAYLDYLYRLDGRSESSHPWHSNYTGLFQQRQEQLLAADMAAALAEG